jgi:hypothetical protein
MMRMPKGWRTGAIGLLALVSLAACVVGGYDGGGYEEGYVGGVYAEGGYDYGGWGGGAPHGGGGGRPGH